MEYLAYAAVGIAVLLGGINLIVPLEPIFKKWSWGVFALLIVVAFVAFMSVKSAKDSNDHQAKRNKWQDSTTQKLKEIESKPNYTPPSLDLVYSRDHQNPELIPINKDTLLFQIVIACTSEEEAYNLRDYAFSVTDTGKMFSKSFLSKTDAAIPHEKHNKSKWLVLGFTGSPEYFHVSNIKAASWYTCVIIKFKDRNGIEQPPFKAIFKMPKGPHWRDKIEKADAAEYFKIDSYATENNLW